MQAASVSTVQAPAASQQAPVAGGGGGGAAHGFGVQAKDAPHVVGVKSPISPQPEKVSKVQTPVATTQQDMVGVTQLFGAHVPAASQTKGDKHPASVVTSQDSPSQHAPVKTGSDASPTPAQHWDSMMTPPVVYRARWPAPAMGCTRRSSAQRRSSSCRIAPPTSCDDGLPLDFSTD